MGCGAAKSERHEMRANEGRSEYFGTICVVLQNSHITRSWRKGKGLLPTNVTKDQPTHLRIFQIETPHVIHDMLDFIGVHFVQSGILDICHVITHILEVAIQQLIVSVL